MARLYITFVFNHKTSSTQTCFKKQVVHILLEYLLILNISEWITGIIQLGRNIEIKYYSIFHFQNRKDEKKGLFINIEPNLSRIRSIDPLV